VAESLPAGGYSPGGKDWLSQAFANPYMQGWGPAQAPGSVPGAPGATPAPVGVGTQINPAVPVSVGPQKGADGKYAPYTFEGSASKEAQKIKRGIKKARDARGWSVKDIAIAAASVAAAVATGGASLTAQLAMAGVSAASSAYGVSSRSKAASLGLNQYQKLKQEFLPQIGWTQGKQHGWYDASGSKMSTSMITQTLLNMGALGD
jgi:hypothetical protein